MCLSRIYTDEKTEENCVMEEVARVESRGGGVEISTLFGESKTLHGYFVNTVDLMENFVFLKKEQKEQTHNHSHKQNKESVRGLIALVSPGQKTFLKTILCGLTHSRWKHVRY